MPDGSADALEILLSQVWEGLAAFSAGKEHLRDPSPLHLTFYEHFSPLLSQLFLSSDSSSDLFLLLSDPCGLLRRLSELLLELLCELADLLQRVLEKPEGVLLGTASLDFFRGKGAGFVLIKKIGSAKSIG